MRWFRRTFPGPPGGKRTNAFLSQSGWVVASFVGLILGAFLIVEANMSQTVIDISRVEARQMAITVFSSEIERTIGTNGQDIFDVTTHGSQAFISVNTTAFDREASVAALAIQKGLERLPEDTITIPLGQALGSKLLAAYGPLVPVRLIPYGSVSINFVETMHQAGINQTFVSVNLNTDTQVQIAVPLVTDTIHLKVSVPLAQEWVVGNVPQTFVGSTSLKSLSIPIGQTTTTTTTPGP